MNAGVQVGRGSLVVLAALVAACEDGVGDELGAPETFAEQTHVISVLQPGPKIDVLLVIDDSPAMAPIQPTIAANMEVIVDVLEAVDVAADYRLAVTTTSVEHPACPEVGDGGALRLSSCHERQDDFAAEGAAGGCAEACTFAAIRTTPTTTVQDDEPRARPWIEHRANVSNLAPIDGRTPTTREALVCAGPQGAGGCDFPAPLEAMRRALLRMHDEGDPQHGFLRPDASLLVVIVTNGHDCSVAPEHAAFFRTAAEGGNPLFWADASAPAPTRAACWNAGVACTGVGPIYDECHAENHAGTGQAGAADADAVLVPTAEISELLAELERAKQAVDPSLEVIVQLVAGVPPEYEHGEAEIVYADAKDAQEQATHGIGASCIDDGFVAHPPVRALAVAAATRLDDDMRSAVSICADDYSGALELIAPPFRGRIEPACMPVCVADADPETAALEPTCHVEWSASDRRGNVERGVLRPCNADQTVPAGEDACVVPLLGDARSDYCADLGWNLEWRIVAREGWRWPEGTLVSATCSVSLDPLHDCPQRP